MSHSRMNQNDMKPSNAAPWFSDGSLDHYRVGNFAYRQKLKESTTAECAREQSGGGGCCVRIGAVKRKQRTASLQNGVVESPVLDMKGVGNSETVEHEDAAVIESET
ncbi:hypothetical protein NA57DRAFT_60910 [Rhizodiscina lignyota]|uniref:Uncharacterized protein n=1 Tax=Rhizodiscina lignyota TaxID=1504668 RepID=A0A9P4I8B9_9PEZI|nr:hypothetical protein NA57DRAFT_60910 [Rhizodiscina lignyota]